MSLRAQRLDFSLREMTVSNLTTGDFSAVQGMEEFL